MKYDLKGTSFIYSCRIDTKQRADNFKAIYNFYKKHCTNYFNFFIEDSGTIELPNLVKFDTFDTYIFKKNSDMYRRCEAFNKGLLLSTSSEIVGFCDIDVIIDPENILKTIEHLSENKNSGLMYPYNGLFLCINESIKKNFSDTLDYDTLNTHFPLNTSINYFDGNVLVGHNNSVGGCVFGRRDNILKCKGYNSNFIGWGYEDNELPNRVHKLGYDVTRLNESKACLWHLPHDGPNSSPKAENPYYENNRKLSNFMDTAKKDDIIEYIKTWNLV